MVAEQRQVIKVLVQRVYMQHNEIGALLPELEALTPGLNEELERAVSFSGDL